MGPTEINGLPAHVLLVHVVVILVPLAALLVVLAAVWPAARRRLGLITPLVALVALISVPVTTHAGEWLEKRVSSDPLVRRHTELGGELLPWVIGLFVLALAGWLWAGYSSGGWPFVRTGASAGSGAMAGAGEGSAAGGASAVTKAPARGAGLAVMIVLAVLSVAVSVGAVVQVYRIGDSGAKAVWDGSFSQTPQAQSKG
ncbi:DUF2231 domain-containing protein [Frankia sp. AiPs1]|uniref:hypothetical protein n=1 Tax=Frankia sp. AiPa1 TaxID=573492 RepID=UPI0035A9365D|nr:hypothetical protein [Frankia sp. AiPa1]